MMTTEEMSIARCEILLAAHRCRNTFEDLKSTAILRIVPQDLSAAGAVGWMEEAAKITRRQMYSGSDHE